MVFSQLSWPGVGDIDDCWVIADIQALNTVAPWLELVGVPVYRNAAGKPDIQGEATGGQLRNTVQAISTLWPQYADNVKARPRVPWDEMLEALNEGRPISLAVLSDALPPRLQHGFRGPTSYHRVCIVKTPAGRLLFANPLAHPYDRWQEAEHEELRKAAYAYGQAKAGHPCAYGVTFPTLDEALNVYDPQQPADDTPYSQADLDKAANAGWNNGLDAAGMAVGAVPRR